MSLIPHEARIVATRSTAIRAHAVHFHRIYFVLLVLPIALCCALFFRKVWALPYENIASKRIKSEFVRKTTDNNSHNRQTIAWEPFDANKSPISIASVAIMSHGVVVPIFSHAYFYNFMDGNNFPQTNRFLSKSNAGPDKNCDECMGNEQSLFVSLLVCNSFWVPNAVPID